MTESYNIYEKKNSRVVFRGDSAHRPVPAVVSVLQVDLGLADQVVRPEEVPVEELDSQEGVLGEGGLDLEAPDGVGEKNKVSVGVGVKVKKMHRRKSRMFSNAPVQVFFP